MVSVRSPRGIVAIATGARASGTSATRSWFKGEIVPKLDSFSLKEIGKATGLSLAARSRTRSGANVPHPRHWDACASSPTPTSLGRRVECGECS